MQATLHRNVTMKSRTTSREAWARKVERLEADIAYETQNLAFFESEGNVQGASVTRANIAKLQAKLDKLNAE